MKLMGKRVGGISLPDELSRTQSYVAGCIKRSNHAADRKQKGIIKKVKWADEVGRSRVKGDVDLY